MGRERIRRVGYGGDGYGGDGYGGDGYGGIENCELLRSTLRPKPHRETSPRDLTARPHRETSPRDLIATPDRDT
jgi:hypothetical protein